MKTHRFKVLNRSKLWVCLLIKSKTLKVRQKLSKGDGLERLSPPPRARVVTNRHASNPEGHAQTSDSSGVHLGCVSRVRDSRRPRRCPTVPPAAPGGDLCALDLCALDLCGERPVCARPLRERPLCAFASAKLNVNWTRVGRPALET
jgi:hypothetical protein